MGLMWLYTSGVFLWHPEPQLDSCGSRALPLIVPVGAATFWGTTPLCALAKPTRFII